MYIASAYDHEDDNGPFASVIWRVGLVKPNQSGPPRVSLYGSPRRVARLDGLKVEAIAFPATGPAAAQQAFITQIAQTADCNCAHGVEGRLAKWLPTCQDRSHSKESGLTQEFIATMLWVRRDGVTQAAGATQQATAISYRTATSSSSTARGWRRSRAGAALS